MKDRSAAPRGAWWRRTAVTAALVVVLAPAGGACLADNWPQFRGPTGVGHSRARDLPIRWGGPDRENVIWTAPLVGEGHASPIVWGDRVFVCTVHWPADVTDRKKVIPEHHVLCYRASDGKRLWDTTVRPGPWLRTDFRSGPGGGYAAPTPATDGKAVYCVWGSAVMAAVDFSGKLLWRHEITPRTFDVTVGGSPILYRDTIVLLCAMAKKSDSRLVAYRTDNGEVKWVTKMPTTAFGHSTPILIDVGGVDQLVTVASGITKTADALQSFRASDGKRQWWCRGCADASSAAYGGGLVYFDSGRGGPGVAVAPGGSGDVSATRIRWTIRNVPGGIGSPILVGEHMYRMHGSYLGCWQLADGKRVYSERLKGISTSWASPVADGRGYLYFANAGTSYVIRSGAKFEVLAVNALGDANHPSPAVAGGRIFLVGAKNVWCVGKK